MQLEDIYRPISEDLILVEKERNKTCKNLSTNYLKGIIGYFFKVPGKRLRPTLAFSLLSNSLPKEFEKTVVELTETMCAAEVIQAENKVPTHEIYLSIIKGKTALFMSVSCKIAASLAGATKEQVK